MFGNMLLLVATFLLANVNIAQQPCSLPDGLNTSTYCVEIGDKVYYNVSEGWQPRIGKTAGWLAVVIPTVYAAIMLLIMAVVSRTKDGSTGRENSVLQQGVQLIKNWYKDLVYYIYFKDYVGEELFTLITTHPAPTHPHYELFHTQPGNRYLVQWRSDGVYVVDAEEWRYGRATAEDTLAARVRVCDNVEGKEFTYVVVTANILLYYRDYKPFFLKFKCVTVPNFVKVVMFAITLVCLPVLALLWDIVDVFFDCYYFQQLEFGNLIDINITRNVYVNNAILTFAILGAVKSTILAYGFYKIITSSYIDIQSRATFLKPIIKCFKIFFEDGVEVILEYYFIDKFVTITTGQQWVLILKDVLTACYYTMPIVNILKDIRKNYKEITSSDRHFTFNNKTINISSYGHVYMSCVVVHLLFSMITVTRVVGTMFQYMTGDIADDCLIVSNGHLFQTPFNSGCLNPFDWFILVLYGLILTLFLAGVTYIFVTMLLLPLFKSASKLIGKKCNNRRFVIDGKRTTYPRYLRVTEECVL